MLENGSARGIRERKGERLDGCDSKFFLRPTKVVERRKAIEKVILLGASNKYAVIRPINDDAG